VHRGGEVTWHNGHRLRAEGPVQVDDKMEERVALLHVYPDMPPDLFDVWAERSRGIVLAGTGLGHVRKPLVTRIRKAIRDGVSVVMTTQCLNGRVGLYVYSRGRELARVGVIPGEDMLPETALVKLMWVLGHTTEPSEVRGLMVSNLAGEINPKLRLEESKPD
ncbi:MAG: Glu-tRNA(Gln) amidotransferase GatDE subunit D, partial [Anaerolineae bacterium]